MWETDFGKRAPVVYVPPHVASRSEIDTESIESVAMTYWREHCLECTPPDCYTSCQLYFRRSDQRCARLQYGMCVEKAFGGLFDYGVDLKFRRWGQIGSKLLRGAASPKQVRTLDKIDRALIRYLARPVNIALSGLDPKQYATRVLVRSRAALLKRISSRTDERAMQFDDFVLEVWNPQSSSVKLILETSQNNRNFRDSLTLEFGRNLVAIPVKRMGLDLGRGNGSIRMYPDNDAELRLVYTWEDFVRYLRTGSVLVALPRQLDQTVEKPQPVGKVKCVVWDLDNTLWRGIMVEDGAEGVVPRPEVIQAIKDLDARGIVQSVASKNGHATAWLVLEQIGVAEYFLHPQINWGPKSSSIKVIADALNIGIDSFAFIDDSPNERAEVASEHPTLRVFDETSVTTLQSSSEFDVPITEASRKRRHYYKAEIARTGAADAEDVDQSEFLRRCEIELRIFPPAAQREIDRCFELVHRTNQLNLATYRYDRTDFEKLLSDTDTMALASWAGDRFGEYGIVGFGAIRTDGKRAELVEFVQSCRVAVKKVEAAWFRSVGEELLALGYTVLHATFVPTPRNDALRQALDEVGFQVVADNGDTIDLVLDLKISPAGSDIVKVSRSFESGDQSTKNQ